MMPRNRGGRHENSIAYPCRRGHRAKRTARRCRGGDQGADRRCVQAGAACRGARIREADRPQGDGRERHRRRAERSGSKAARLSTSPCSRPRPSTTSPARASSSTAAASISRASASASWSRPGAPKPDISSVEAFKRALLAAKSVAYIDPASGGSSGIYVAGLLDKLGIADQVKPKAKLKQGGYVADLIVAARPSSAFIRSARSCR